NFAYEQGRAITVDPQGNAYIAGVTHSPDFPITANAYQQYCNNCGIQLEDYEYTLLADGFVTKVFTDGILGWSTFLGGSLEDGPQSIAVSPQGNVYVSGITHSSDFPVADAPQSTFGGG